MTEKDKKQSFESIHIKVNMVRKIRIFLIFHYFLHNEVLLSCTKIYCFCIFNALKALRNFYYHFGLSYHKINPSKLINFMNFFLI